MDCSATRLCCVRYGNVLSSRGSVVPLFHEQIRRGGPVTLTTRDMTRFLLSLHDAVDTVFAALCFARRGETFIPRAPSARMTDLADVLIGPRKIAKTFIGIRPGEKIHEILISEEEAPRAVERGRYYAILPMLPELRSGDEKAAPLAREYSSADDVMKKPALAALLKKHKLMVEDRLKYEEDMLA